MDHTTITLPFSEQALGVILFALGLAVATGLLTVILSEQNRKTARDPLSLLTAFGWVLLPVWLVIFVATLWQVWLILTGGTSPLTASTSLGTGALIAALLGAPFVIWGTVLKQRNTDLTDAALHNDKINAAVESLYARRQTTRAVASGDTEQVLTEWEDDILKRSAAIDRLEGLAHERPSEAPRIASMLSIYVRELSRENPPQDHPRQAWHRLIESEDDSMPMSEEQAFYHLGLNPDDVSIDALEAWARGLRPIRADMEKAAQTLGRLRDIPDVVVDDIKVDLREANLRGFDLASLNFNTARMEGTQMEGANLFMARMEGAVLIMARMEGANLALARIEGANLALARMERAALRRARMEGTDLTLARMEGADLSEARMEGAVLSEAQMEEADLSRARMDSRTSLKAATIQGAAMRNMDYSDVGLSENQVNSAFGDASVTLPKRIARPTHWPNWVLPDTGPHAFFIQWRKWLSNPATYTPPDNPDGCPQSHSRDPVIRTRAAPVTFTCGRTGNDNAIT